MGFLQTANAAVRASEADMIGSGSVLDVWRTVRARLRAEYGDILYAAEIARLRVEEDRQGRVCVICPNAFGRAWAEDNLGARLRAIWASVEAGPRDIVITTEATMSRETAEPAHAGSGALDRAALRSGAARAPLAAAPAPAAGEGREPRFTFDTFMVGSANMMAATAARAVANASAPPFNPVYFHGDYGVGKTHLLAAIAHAVGLGESGRKALYLTAEEFLNGFQSALRARDVQPFKDQVRDCDVLLVDDIHFIAGKQATELEFLQTLAALMAADKQVVLASHCAPGELGAADPRLRDILAGGFACPMNGPDLDLRRKILDCKIAQARRHCPDLEVPETVRDFLAARVTSSARELEGVLNNIIVRTAYMNRAVTLETVEEALGELPVKAEKRITVDDIQKAAAAHFSVTTEDLVSKSRTKTLVRPRHIAMYLAKTMTTRSLPDIGRRFGGRDHSTVIHAVSKITEALSRDAALAEDVEAIRRRLRG
ncbi:chromosomal replication initiator protein DnaA [Alkalicaulis satelles]|uniref:Chromosomal replication initiator protein DnaA n=1 Tax=Alkalicaulis satelles TaxID=2609175 RepID=A0A5M6ZH02_9PROT|nr:chromosomal replication initiator protein DnaA [Alkalicaulis satelles]KAA5802428.1 chromosomal replication initiator protein DnaA [Alkalicaulis satelles]